MVRRRRCCCRFNVRFDEVVYRLVTCHLVWMCYVMTEAAADISNGTSFSNEGVTLSSRDICQLETFHANCSSVTYGGNSARSKLRLPEVIVIQSARYGRMRFGRCVTRDYGHVGCGVDMLAEVDALCSGRLKTCQFPVSRLHSAAVGGAKSGSDDQILSQPCPGDLTSYLEASYSCIPVVSTINQQSCRVHSPIVITSASGYLSSAITMATGQGGRECPWRVQLPVGQRMNATLISFFSAAGAWYDSVQALPTTGQTGRSIAMTTATTTTRPNACYQLAIFREGMDASEVARTVTECEGGPRTSHAYLSESNTIDVEILVPRSQNHRKLYFLLHYTAVGCSTSQLLEASTPTSSFTLIRRDNDEATVRCNATGLERKLFCRGTEWTILFDSPSAANSGDTGGGPAIVTAAAASNTTNEQLVTLATLCGSPSAVLSVAASSSSSSAATTGSKQLSSVVGRGLAQFPYSILAVVTVGVALGVVVGGVLLLCSTKYFKRYQDTAVADVDCYSSGLRCHDTGFPVAALHVVNSNDLGQNITSQLLKPLQPTLSPKRLQPVCVTSLPAYMTPSQLVGPSVYCEKCLLRLQNVDNCNDGGGKHKTEATSVTGTKFFIDTTQRHVTLDDNGRMSRVVCCGPNCKVEPVPLRASNYDGL